MFFIYNNNNVFNISDQSRGTRRAFTATARICRRNVARDRYQRLPSKINTKKDLIKKNCLGSCYCLIISRCVVFLLLLSACWITRQRHNASRIDRFRYFRWIFFFRVRFSYVSIAPKKIIIYATKQFRFLQLVANMACKCSRALRR